MIKVALNGIHVFKKTHDFTKTDRKELFNVYQCNNCKLIGRRLSIRDSFIYVSDTYSKKRIELCEKDKFIDKYVGKQIQISCKIIGTSAYSNASIYSTHTIIKPPHSKKEINGERGVWIMGAFSIPIKIFFDEYVEWPIAPRTQPLKEETRKGNWIIGSGGFPIKKRVRTKIKRTRTKIKRKRTIVKRTRTIVKRKRTIN